ncbi:MAG: transglutaminase domain-containing protein [Candidatus Heimdallarchaeota archaeon]|nr:transglutaminase domain-containing protein [Candidatus Heimdallarchaeota archaeon]
MSQGSQKPQSDLASKKISEQSAKGKRKIFSRENLSKIILPSLFLIAIIMTPVLFEAFNVRHERIDDIIDKEYDDNWPFPGIGDAPSQNLDPSLNNDTDDFMDQFTEGIPAESQDIILYRISPYDPNNQFYWRMEAYDTYTMFAWERNFSLTSYPGYSSSSGDGEFSVTSMEMTYLGSQLSRYFPAPYHYINSEKIYENYQFDPSYDIISSSMDEDMYGCKVITGEFVPTIANTTLSYIVEYTKQNNSDIKTNSAGYSDLAAYLSLDSQLAARYLQIPTSYSTNAPYTTTIASNLYDPTKTIYSQVMKNMLWLSTNCTYDINMLLGLSNDAPASGEDYVEWFLNRHSGTAAHFAASLAIICRLQNIPSRIVIGFSYGDNDGSEFLIRAKHLHSWVEIFIPFSGTTGYWVAFDPSPLIPTIRESYGNNVIGANPIFYCSNEFFLFPHMLPTAPSPYIFEPNPLSNAWYQDPYPPNAWYGPYVNRTQSFTIFAILASGSLTDLLYYLFTGNPGDLDFIEGEEIIFYDTTDNILLGSAITDSGGNASISYAYPIATNSGLHKISAKWLGVEVPTYDLQKITVDLNEDDFYEAGIILTGVINITSGYLEQIINSFYCTEFNQKCVILGFSLDMVFQDCKIILITIIPKKSI